MIFDAGLEKGQERASTTIVALLIICGFLTGNGGAGGASGALNAVAKSFPEHMVSTQNPFAKLCADIMPTPRLYAQRTSSTGFVLSGFGLSAFLFSTIAHSVFPGNTSDFLLVLAIGTSLPMVLGWLFIRPIPLPIPNGASTLEGGIPAPRHATSARRSYFEGSDDSGTRLLPDNELDYDETYVRSPRQHARAVSVASCGEVGTSVLPENELPNISGKELFMSLNFWLLFSITSLRESLNVRHISGY